MFPLILLKHLLKQIEIKRKNVKTIKDVAKKFMNSGKIPFDVKNIY